MRRDAYGVVRGDAVCICSYHNLCICRKNDFDSLFGIQKTLGNTMNNWKKQMDAVKDISVGFNAAVRGDADMEEKAEQAINSLDAAIYGDRTEWIRRADEALAEFDRQAH